MGEGRPPRPPAWLAGHPAAQNEAALDRIALGAARVRKILERETLAHQRTLEQKISDQGPPEQHVDPHLLGLSLKDLLERDIIRAHTHSGVSAWYAHSRERPEKVREKLDQLGPLYAQVSKGAFPNRVGDALEIVVFKCLQELTRMSPAIQHFGHFDLEAPLNSQGRHPKHEPPKRIGRFATEKCADFLLIGYPVGPVLIECKNYREWLYPHHGIIRELIIKSFELNSVPVMIHRRLHYTTRTNLFEPAGIIAHESYFQYYPTEEAGIAAAVKHKRSMGFSDVTAASDPHWRTQRFFQNILPKILPDMAAKWNANKDALYAYATEEIHLAELYNAIGSPAGGKWEDREEGPVAEDY